MTEARILIILLVVLVFTLGLKLVQESKKMDQKPITIDIENIFTYHLPKGDQATRYKILRGACMGLAEMILEQTPMCREQSIAIRKLEEACMWANAAIARNE